MSPVRILRETEDTVTISRDDWQRLQDQLADAQDRAAIVERRSHEQQVGKETARRDYLTGEEALRLLGGESPVKVWRQKRGLSQRALAAAAGIGNGYLADIETYRKPGSDDARRKLAARLHVPPEELDARRYRTRDPNFGPVYLSWSPISAGVAAGSRAALIEREEIASLGEALKRVSHEWSWMRTRAPSITDLDHWPIYKPEELFQECEC